MIPITVTCGCGQRYAFDYDPSGPELACSIQCPICGEDGSDAANKEINRQQPPETSASGGLRIHRRATVTADIPPSAPSLPGKPALAATALSINPGRPPKTVWFTVCAALALSFAIAGILILRPKERKQLSEAPQKTSGVTLPNSPEELNAWYIEPPQGQNAATLYLQAFSILTPAKIKLPPPLAPMSSSTKTALETVLLPNRDALALLRQSVIQERSRYPVDLTQGFEALLPHLAKLRNAEELLKISATWHAAQHHGMEAGMDVFTGLSLASSLEAEPILLSQFIRAAAISTSLEALEQALNHTSLPPESLNKLARKFQELEAKETKGEAFNRALVGERATALFIFRAPDQHFQKLSANSLGMKPQERDQWLVRLKEAQKVKEESEYYETTFQEMIRAREKPFPARLQADQVGRDRAQQARSKGMVMNAYLAPSRMNTTAKEATCLAHLRLGATALALEQFRALHANQYPATLSELPRPSSPDAVTDPFDGAPLRYEKKDPGYLLYSIGPDLQDDAGERTRGKDLVFEVGGFADTAR